MQVCKWGHSLAIRLLASVVQALQLKEGAEASALAERFACDFPNYLR